MTESRSVVVRLTAETAQYLASMAEAGRSTDKAMSDAEKKAKKASAAFDDLAGKAGKIGLAAAGALGLAGKAAVDWESAWTGVTKTVDGTTSQMAELESGLRDMAKTLPATHGELAAVAEAAGQLGIEREGILDFTETMVALGETTNLTADAAATAIAQISNVMGTSVDDVDNFGAALVALGNDGASTEAEILSMAQRIAGAGAQIGLAETDILAISNAAASMGINAEAGGSAISRVFTDMAKATKQGGEDLETFAKVAGVSSQDFVRAFEEDPARAFASFTQGLDRIKESGGDVFTTLDDLGLSDVRVSQALLSMAASGDLLTDSLDLGAEAWGENTALAEEFAKRLGTTESEVRVAWNNIKDAGIEMGQVLLPVISSAAETVATLGKAFGALPDPVQNSVVALLGITAVFGGGLWFTAKVINGVTSTRTALKDLGITGDKTAGVLGKVGKAAGVAGAALASMAIVDQLQTQFDGLDTGLEGVTKQILGLADGGATSKLSGEFKNLGDSFERLTDANAAQRFQDSIYDTVGFLGSDSRVDEAVAQFEAVDSALTKIAVTAGSGEAQAGFDALAESMGLTAGEQEKLLELLPQYQDALTGIENDAKLAADATSGFDQMLAQMEGQAGDTAGEIDGVADAVDDVAESFQALTGLMDKQSAFANAKAAMRDLTEGLKENGRTLNLNTDAGKANLDLIHASIEGHLTYAEHLSGPARATYLEGVRAGLHKTLKDSGLLNKDTRALLEELDKLGEKEAKPEVKAEGVPKAKGEVLDLLQLLNDLPPVTTTYVDTIHRVRGSRGGQLIAADGATVPDDGGPYADRFPYLLAPKEEVISNRHGQADNARKLLKLTNRGLLTDRMLGLAGGGTVGRLAGGGTSKAFHNFDIRPSMDVSDVQAELRSFRIDLKEAGGEWTDRLKVMSRDLVATSRSLDRHREQLDAERDQLADLRKQRQDFTGQVAGNFRTQAFNQRDVFGNGGLAATFATLENDTARASEFDAALDRARRLGLDGDAFRDLAASGDVATAQDLDSRAEVQRLERLYAERTRVTAQLGSESGTRVFGKAMEQQVAELRRLHGEIGRLAGRLARMGDRVENGAARGTRAGIEQRGRNQASAGRI